MPETASNHDRILDIVVQKDEVTWQSMIYELVKHEGMNPWDIDVSLLSARYIQMLKKFNELDFRVSGKVVLASAILLKIKSQKLLNDDMGELDKLMSRDEEMSSDEFYEDLESEGVRENPGIPALIPRTPQPRKRKVSIYDLMIALQKALEVRDRRVMRRIPSVTVEVPARKVDITKLIGNIMAKINTHYDSTAQKLSFDALVEGLEKTAKVHHIISLLHLANIDHRKIDLIQEEHFGRIDIVKADPIAAKAADEAEEKAELEASAKKKTK